MDNKRAEEAKHLAKHRRELLDKSLKGFDQLIHALASSMSFYYGCDAMPIGHVKELRDRITDIWWDIKALDKIQEREDSLLREPPSQSETERD